MSFFCRWTFISPHGIAIPNGLYFTTVVFFFLTISFFIRRLISEVSERISWTHIHLWLRFDKFGPNSPGYLPPPPHGLGAKTALWDRLWTFTEHISATERDINNRKETYQSTGTPLHARQIWWTLVQKAENNWRVFDRPVNFCTGRHCQCQPYHGRQTLARVRQWHELRLQSKTTGCWAGSRWALPRI